MIIFYSYLRSNCVVKNTNTDQKVQTTDAHTKFQKVWGSLGPITDFIIQNYTRIWFRWDSTGNVFINTKKKLLGLLLSHVMWRTTPLLWWLNLLMSSFTLITSDFFISIIIICIIFTYLLECWSVDTIDLVCFYSHVHSLDFFLH